MGRTPWSARVALDPLYAKRKNPQLPKRPTGVSAADQGVRPASGTAAHVRRLSLAIPTCRLERKSSSSLTKSRLILPDRQDCLPTQRYAADAAACASGVRRRKNITAEINCATTPNATSAVIE